jgi:hypothetical protein
MYQACWFRKISGSSCWWVQNNRTYFLNFLLPNYNLEKSQAHLIYYFHPAQRRGISVDTAADSAATDEPLVMAMSLQQRVLQAAHVLSLQIPQNPITANPPAPISLSGEPEHLPHLPPPPPAPRVYSVNVADVQVI